MGRKMNHEKWLGTNADIYFVLLQTRSTLLGPGLLSLETLLFNKAVRGLC